MKSASRTSSNETETFRWPLLQKLNRNKTNSLGHGINPTTSSNNWAVLNTALSTPTSPKQNNMLCRQRQSSNNASSLHVAAIFASAARQLSTIATSDSSMSSGVNRYFYMISLFDK